MRKKDNYSPHHNVRFIIIDCCFKIKIEHISIKIAVDLEENSQVILKIIDSVARYIIGSCLIGNIDWDLVDYVLMPVNLKENHH